MPKTQVRPIIKKKKKVTRRGSALTTPGARKKSVVLSEFEKLKLKNKRKRIKAESELDESRDKFAVKKLERLVKESIDYLNRTAIPHTPHEIDGVPARPKGFSGSTLPRLTSESEYATERFKEVKELIRLRDQKKKALKKKKKLKGVERKRKSSPTKKRK